MFRTVAVVIAALFLTGHPLAAGQQGRTVNPEAIEFDARLVDQSPLTQYRVELFKAGSDTRVDLPIKSIAVDPQAFRGDGTLRVDLSRVLTGVPDGKYVAMLWAIAADGSHDHAESSQSFVVSREAALGELTGHERLFMKIAWGVMAGVLLIPFLVR
jgi:hypothetical protein